MENDDNREPEESRRWFGIPVVILRFPLSVAMGCALVCAMMFLQVLLLLVVFAFLVIAHRDAFALLPHEFWVGSGIVFFVAVPMLVVSYFLMRFAWKQAKIKHPQLATPRH